MIETFLILYLYIAGIVTATVTLKVAMGKMPEGLQIWIVLLWPIWVISHLLLKRNPDMLYNDSLDRALAYANDPIHEGCGYSLLITFQGGETHELTPLPHGLFENEKGEPVFINKAAIQTVTVQW